MDMLFQQNQTPKQQLGVVPAIVATAATAAPKVIEAVKKIASKIKGLFKKQRDDKALLAVRDALDDVLTENGYARPDRGGIPGAPSFTAFNLRDSQVSGKSNDYKYAYERLQNFLVAMFNAYKPGLGNEYKAANPVTMKNSKEVSDQWIDNVVAVIMTNPVASKATTQAEVTTQPQQAGGGVGLALVAGAVVLAAFAMRGSNKK